MGTCTPSQLVQLGMQDHEVSHPTWNEVMDTTKRRREVTVPLVCQKTWLQVASLAVKQGHGWGAGIRTPTN
jgi:hypothetical protein